MATISLFELDVECRNGVKCKYRLCRTGEHVKANVARREADGEKVAARGEHAVEEIEHLLAKIKAYKDISETQLLGNVCAALLVRSEDVELLYIAIEFTIRTEIQAAIASSKAGSAPKRRLASKLRCARRAGAGRTADDVIH